jgi:hypothetical protein
MKSPTIPGRFKDNGVIDIGKAKVFLLSFRLLIGVIRSGYYPEMIFQEKNRYQAYKRGPGANSQEIGRWSMDTALKILEKYGGYKGYKALPRGEKGPVVDEIAKAIRAKDRRNIYNIIRKIGLEVKDEN